MYFLIIMNLHYKLRVFTRLLHVLVPFFFFLFSKDAIQVDEMITAYLDENEVFMQNGDAIVWTNQIVHAQLWNDPKRRYFFDFTIGNIEDSRSWSKVNWVFVRFNTK